MRKTMIACGVLCLLFGVFHLLFWPLLAWPASLSYMKAQDRMLMQTFNFCLTPLFFLLGWAYLRLPHEVAGSRLGRIFSAIPITIFGFRALAEPLFGDLRTGESWFFLILCLGVAALFALPLCAKRQSQG